MFKRWFWTAPLLLTACLPGATPAPPAGPAKAHDWPGWRGPQRTGISAEKGLLQSWPKGGPKLAWKVKGLGEGFSTPSVAAGRIFCMGNVPTTAGKRETQECVVALKEEDGSQLWSTPIGQGGEAGGFRGPRCSPTVDGDLVYALGVRGTLVCLESATGKEVWRKDLREDFGGRVGGWGYCESPLIDGDKLVCTPGGKTTLVALNKKTGDTIWKGEVPEGDEAHYSSIIVADAPGGRQYIQVTGGGVVGVSAETGKFLWRSNKLGGNTANCSTAVYHDGCVFTAAGYGKGGDLVKLSSDGDKVKAVEAYHTKDMVNHHGNMVFLDGYVYGSCDGEFLTCLEFKTGKTMWKERKPGKGSVSFADGRLYYRNEGGPVVLVAPDPAGYKEEGRFDQPDRSGQSAWPHPVIANGKLYIRDQDLLLCYDVKQ